jgi:hypothetical protein
MKMIDISKKSGEWVARSGGQTLARGTRKTDVVRETARSARSSGEPVSVRIRNVDGKIAEERTYPRGADPRRSRG